MLAEIRKWDNNNLSLVSRDSLEEKREDDGSNKRNSEVVVDEDIFDF